MRVPTAIQFETRRRNAARKAFDAAIDFAQAILLTAAGLGDPGRQIVRRS